MDGQFEKSGVMCCFCNENIIISDIDPCDINIMANWDKPEHTKKEIKHSGAIMNVFAVKCIKM